jgi:hypothetical protein
MSKVKIEKSKKKKELFEGYQEATGSLEGADCILYLVFFLP